MKILVVDDCQELAMLVRVILASEGFEVYTVFGSPEAFLAYCFYRPDLVITDIRMPGKNGLELMNQIRDKDPKVKAIYMSGDLDEFYSHLKEEKIRYPVQILTKPFTREELMKKVSQFSG